MASDLTPEELAELRKLLAKSTPGPFGVVATAQASRGGKPTPSMDQYSLRTMIPTAITTSGGELTSLPLDIGGGLGEADARFFAAMRNHAAKLLDMAERCAKAEAKAAAYDRLRESQREQWSSITRDIVKAQNKQGNA